MQTDPNTSVAAVGSLPDLNGKTVLITGGAGFIGSNLAMHIQQHYPDCEIVVFDSFLLGHFKNLVGFTGRCIAGDIANADDMALLNEFNFDHIFHQAAISDTTVTDQKMVVQINTNAFKAILDIAKNSGASVVYASSAATYGNSPAPNRVGEGEVPENVYGFSKLQMDHLSRCYSVEHGINIVGLRYFNVYGPREEHKLNTASMILQLSQKLLKGERPKLFKHGEQSRDFISIVDVVQANLKAITANRSGVYNVGSGKARTFNDVLEILQDKLEAHQPVEYVDNPWTFYQNHTEADIESTRQELGYVPQFSLEMGIEYYLPEIRRIAGDSNVIAKVA